MARNKLRPYLDALMALVSSLLIIGSATSLIMQRENGIIILREDELFLMGQGFFIFAVLIFIKMSDSAKYVYAFFVFGVNIFANVYILHKGINQLRLAILGVSWFGFVILMFLGWFHLLNTKHRMVLLLIPVTMVIGGSFGVILKGMELTYLLLIIQGWILASLVGILRERNVENDGDNSCEALNKESV